MKAIFYLPAHPSYFDFECTQEQIERAVGLLKRMTGGAVSGSNRFTKADQEYVLLRQPGKSVTVVVESSVRGCDDRGVELYLEASIELHQITVATLTKVLQDICNGIKLDFPFPMD